MGGEPATPIPLHIHQIWLGRNPRPEAWMETVRDFAKEHGFRYTLWTDRKVVPLVAAASRDIPGFGPLYKSFGDELAGRADLIRTLILLRHGGIYIDADSVVLKPAKFAAFLRDNKAAVFFGWENLSAARTRKLGHLEPVIRRQRRLVANGIIGAVSGHPFLRALLEGAADNARQEAGEHAWRRVGPLYVTRMYHRLRSAHPDVHVYPMRYFYPRHWGGITDPELHKKVQIPGESMLFQYGYSTNGFAKIFAERERQRAVTRRAKGRSSRSRSRS